MNITADKILNTLPPFRDERVLIKQDQKVNDIINQILISHDNYAAYYDKFALYFDADTTEKICTNIYNFLRSEIKYKEESDQYQTTALPAAILSWRQGDCKHYASFTGGVLSAIERLTGKKFKWCYRFASYDLLMKTPHHVFVVVFDGDQEIWIDPVPGAEKIVPVWQLDKYIKNNYTMPLYDVIGGIPEIQSEESTSDDQLAPEVSNAIETLLQYGVINEQGAVNNDRVQELIQILPEDEWHKVNDALQLITGGTISGLFSSIAHVASKIALAPARGAFLALVALNFRDWAAKFHTAFTDPETGAANIEKVRAKWYPAGGDWVQLMAAIDNGKDKKMLGSIGVVAATALATASAIVAMIIPVLDTIMKNLHINQNNLPTYTPTINPATGLPYTTLPTTSTGNNFMNWVKQNPLPVIAVLGAGGYYLLNKKKKKVNGIDNSTLLLIAAAAGVYFLTKKDDPAAEDPGTITPGIIPDPGTITPGIMTADPAATDPVLFGNPADPSNPLDGAVSPVYSNDPYPLLLDSPATKIFKVTESPVDQYNNILTAQYV